MNEQKAPKFKPTLLKQGVATKITFTADVPVATGTGKYGDWMLYPLTVENCKVMNGNEAVDPYTGEAVVFCSLLSTNAEGVQKPIKIWNKIIPQLAKGNFVFMITKIGKETAKGTIYMDFLVTLEDGTEL